MRNGFACRGVVLGARLETRDGADWCRVGAGAEVGGLLVGGGGGALFPMMMLVAVSCGKVGAGTGEKGGGWKKTYVTSTSIRSLFREEDNPNLTLLDRILVILVDLRPLNPINMSVRALLAAVDGEAIARVSIQSRLRSATPYRR